ADIPQIGVGSWDLLVSPKNTTASIKAALQLGFRHVDTAKAYDNQVAVGKGIKEGLEAVGVKREEIWVTSKLFNDMHDKVEEAYNQTLKELGLEYLDLYLMHWSAGQPGGKGPHIFDYVEVWQNFPLAFIESYSMHSATWQQMEKLVEDGRVRKIGICNFAPSELFRLLRSAKIKPYVHQFELHPYLQQRWWEEWHKANGIKVTGYSPLGNTNPIYKGRSIENGDARDPHTSSIAERRGCTTAQVALAWGMKRGHVVIPKSSHEAYHKENWASLGCVEKLDFQDLKEIEYIGNRWLHRFNNPAKTWGVHLF
ncbi:Aldo/keto reductase, partial [Rhizodiscina lignyota]